jgi:hypothetical protein
MSGRETDIGPALPNGRVEHVDLDAQHRETQLRDRLSPRLSRSHRNQRALRRREMIDCRQSKCGGVIVAHDVRDPSPHRPFREEV